MTKQIDHNKLLKKIAKERLKPYGIFQHGQSRIFLYDRGWFTIVIEFQPSSWSKGTYLNIGVDFNFYPRDYFAYSFGYRERGFEEFKDEGQFIKLMNELCDLTIIRVKVLDLKFTDILTALKTVDDEKEKDNWRIYDVAILNALASNFEKSRKQLEQVSKIKCVYDWEIERKKLVDELLEWMLVNPDSIDKIKSIISETRQLKKLPKMTLDNIT
ncbi:hypothetical protein [Flavobacterium filum]|uniref:hypothetical protein n=1 Tax=Flavobacterium filum TaxID=370974 RepID=UPI0023F108C8|nr:hypothetical protein [Flavobacterium filum]